MKKTKLYLVLGMAFIYSASLNVQAGANYTSFAGSAGYNWVRVSNDNLRKDFGKVSAVNWKTSDSDDHSMVFRVVDRSHKGQGSILVHEINKGVVYFSTTCSYGNYYYLEASREHIIDPYRYVTGTWAS